MFSRDSTCLGFNLVHVSTRPSISLLIRSREADADDNLLYCCFYSLYNGRLLASFVRSGMALADRIHLLRRSPIELYAIPLLPSLSVVIYS